MTSRYIKLNVTICIADRLFALCSGAFLLLLQCLALSFHASPALAQQFNSDNQWVAPHGVGTFVVTAGQEYSAVIAVAALIKEYEFNIGITSYYNTPDGLTDGHDTGIFYVKHRIFENEEGNGGLAVSGGSGVDPSHLENGVVTDTFKSWWANVAYTMPFLDGKINLDLLPGILVNLNEDKSNESAWGFTYSSRVAFYGVIPQSAIVAEVFGTAGEASAKPSYRFGVRWESKKLIMAATYCNAFDGSGGAGFELGLMYLTEPRFCFGGCK